MRTTIRLDDPLLRKAKASAAERGISLNDFISEAIRVAIQPRDAARRRVALPTFAGGSLLRGVDLDDSAGLAELMEEERRYPAPHQQSRGTAQKVAEGPPKRGAAPRPARRK